MSTWKVIKLILSFLWLLIKTCILLGVGFALASLVFAWVLAS